ncbi:MAG: Holliday junction branch migration protein RuvA [Raineya sp.]|nr:Holliday junction branch migration protein RuvA [Raineya sp.]
MFAYIRGILTHKEHTHAIIETGGVGYFIKISLHTYGLLGEIEKEAFLHTYLHIQENAHNLFGFAEISEKKLFLELINISGIGPNTALVMLSSATPNEIQQAIAQEDVKTLQAIKGIGAKTAQRVVLELKDKIKKDFLVESGKIAQPTPFYRSVKEEAVTALVVLGVARNIAEKNVEAILKLKDGKATVEEVIKLALKM